MKNSPSNVKYVMKVVFVGLGATSVFKRHLKDFDEISSSFWSVGFEPSTMQFSYPDKDISMQIWNLDMSPRLTEVRKLYMQNSLGLVVFFQQSHRESFTQVSTFVHDFKKSNKRNFPNFSSSQLLLINLLSSQEGVELVSTAEAQVLASSLGMSYYEFSLEDGKKLREILSTLAEAIFLMSRNNIP